MEKKFLNTIILALLLFSCGGNETEGQEINSEKEKSIPEKVDIDVSVVKEKEIPPTWFKKGQDEERYEYWTQNQERIDSVTSLTLLNYSTIPEKFSVFKNVKHLKIMHVHSVEGLEMFPDITSFELSKCGDFNIEPNLPYLKNLISMRFMAGTHVDGFKSFKDTPKIERLVSSYSGFNVFPDDIGVLTKLKRIELIAYEGFIDLATMDFSYCKQLEYADMWCGNGAERQGWGLVNKPIGLDLSKQNISYHSISLEEFEEKTSKYKK